MCSNTLFLFFAYFLISNQYVKQILKLIIYNDKTINIYVIKLSKIMYTLKEEIILKYLVKNDLFDSIF